MKLVYAGIGSRKTPLDILDKMTQIASYMKEKGWHLRSGGADGADSAFEDGAGDDKTIFVPWKNFREGVDGDRYLSYEESEILTPIAKEHHPVWGRLTHGARKLHTRNVAQVLGVTGKDPADCIICWTPGGRVSGGTGQALRIAETYNVPVYNMAVMSTPEIIVEVLNRARAKSQGP